jgi:hypothetical protein
VLVLPLTAVTANTRNSRQDIDPMPDPFQRRSSTGSNIPRKKRLSNVFFL